MLILVLSIFVAYIILRVILLLLYLNINKELSIVFHEIDPHAEQYTLLARQWVYIYEKDTAVKRIGNLIIALMALLGVIINIHASSIANLLIIGMFPAFTQIFNSIFEWLEIDSPVMHKPIHPERWLFKRYIRDKEYYKLWCSVDKLNAECRAAVLESLLNGNKGVGMSKMGKLQIDIYCRLFEPSDSPTIKLEEQAYLLLIDSAKKYQKISNTDTMDVKEQLVNKFR